MLIELILWKAALTNGIARHRKKRAWQRSFRRTRSALFALPLGRTAG